MNRTSDLRVLILNLWSSTDKNSSFDPDNDFGLGCRNVSHFYRQQSFSGLPTPRWLKTARSNVTSGFKPFTIQTTILANIISWQQQLNKKKTTTNKHTDRERSLSNTETLFGNSIITEMIYFTGCLLHCHISLCTFDDFTRSSRHFTWCCWRDQVLPHSKFYSTGWWSGEKWWRNCKNWMNQFKKYIFSNYSWTPSFKRVSMG